MKQRQKNLRDFHHKASNLKSILKHYKLIGWAVLLIHFHIVNYWGLLGGLSFLNTFHRRKRGGGICVKRSYLYNPLLTFWSDGISSIDLTFFLLPRYRVLVFTNTLNICHKLFSQFSKLFSLGSPVGTVLANFSRWACWDMRDPLGATLAPKGTPPYKWPPKGPHPTPPPL